MITLPKHCRHCLASTPHIHLHDTAHGIPETHISGSERYECVRCGTLTFARDGVPGFTFVLDGTPERRSAA